MTLKAKVKLLFVAGALLMVGTAAFFVWGSRRTAELSTDDAEVEKQLVEMTFEPRLSAFGVPVMLKVATDPAIRADYIASFDDGVTATLKRINDSRCPQSTRCLGGGELTAVIVFEGGNLARPLEVTISERTKGEQFVPPAYTLLLLDITMTDVVFSLSKKEP